VHVREYFIIKAIGVDEQGEEVAIDPQCLVGMSIKPDNLFGLYSKTLRYGVAREGVEILVFKEPPSGIQECNIDIISGIAGAIGTGKVTVMKKEALDHFELKIVPDTAATNDTVAYTEGAKLVIQAKDKENKNVELDVNSLLKFSVSTNEEYGTFINANDDTLKISPVQLTDVKYGDAKEGKIKFAAVKKNPDSLVTCNIRVELQNDVTKKGDTVVVIVEQTLKIMMDTPYVVLPTKLLGRANQPVTVENRKPFVIQLTRNKATVPSYLFNLTTNYVDGTKGHDHIEHRRLQNTQVQMRENYGYFIRTRDNTNQDRPYGGQTRTDGRERFDFVASMFGDSMRIIVESANEVKKKFLRDSITIAEKVQDLLLLADGADYDLVGGTCNHHGPSDRDIPQRCQTPDNNHYATAGVIINIQNIASAYYRQFPRAEVLKVNDMSLEYGGRFDFRGQWEGYLDHQYHRQGTDVDIRSTSIPDDDRYRDINRNGRYDRGEPIKFDLNGNGQYDYTNTVFEGTCRDNGGRARLEYPGDRNEHYHIYFYEYNR
jgi:hypothetical protein